MGKNAAIGQYEEVRDRNSWISFVAVSSDCYVIHFPRQFFLKRKKGRHQFDLFKTLVLLFIRKKPDFFFFVPLKAKKKLYSMKCFFKKINPDTILPQIPPSISLPTKHFCPFSQTKKTHVFFLFECMSVFCRCVWLCNVSMKRWI